MTTPGAAPVPGADARDYEMLPCGCQLWKEGPDDDGRLMYVPCSLSCRYYRYTVEETRRAGKPVHMGREG